MHSFLRSATKCARWFFRVKNWKYPGDSCTLKKLVFQIANLLVICIVHSLIGQIQVRHYLMGKGPVDTPLVGDEMEDESLDGKGPVCNGLVWNSLWGKFWWAKVRLEVALEGNWLEGGSLVGKGPVYRSLVGKSEWAMFLWEKVPVGNCLVGQGLVGKGP